MLGLCDTNKFDMDYLTIEQELIIRNLLEEFRLANNRK